MGDAVEQRTGEALGPCQGAIRYLKTRVRQVSRSRHPPVQPCCGDGTGRHIGAGRGRRPAISCRISANSGSGIATSGTHQIYYSVLGQSHYMTKQYKAARAASEQSVSRDPTARAPRFWLVAAYAQLRQMGDAQRHAKELLRLWPNFSLLRLAEFLPTRTSLIWTT